MNTRDLKALNESIESVMSHDEARDIVHNFIHSLTELASQTDGLEEGYQAKRMRVIKKAIRNPEKVTGGVEDYLLKTYARKKVRRGQIAAKYPEMTAKHGGGALGDMHTRAALRKKAMDAKGLGEGYQAQRMRVIKKEIRNPGEKKEISNPGKVTGGVKDYLKKTYARKKVRQGQIAAKYPEMSKKHGGGALGDMHTRATLRNKAMDAKGLSEEWGGGFQSSRDAHRELQAGLRREASAHRKVVVGDIKAVLAGKMTKNAFTRKHKIKFGEHTLAKRMAAKAKAKKAAKGLSEEASLSEGMYKKLMRLKGKAYKSQGSPSYGKVKRGEAELEAKVSAQRARRGGASLEAVKGGGSLIGKRGKPTDKAARLARQRQSGLGRFHGREVGHEYGIIRGGGRAEDKVAKRKQQQAQAEFEKKSRTGDFPVNPNMLKQVLSWKYRKNK